MNLLSHRTGAEEGISIYEEMPLSQVLLRYLWPFWLFKDASRGDCYARAAAYRHNRRMRAYLPGYLLRWLVGTAGAFAVTVSLGARASTGIGRFDLFALLAAGWAIVFAVCLCVLLVIGYIYFYLGRHET